MSKGEKISVTEDSSGLAVKLEPAAQAIREGKLVIFPTETIYGLAARADLPSAIQKIYSAKKRPSDKPFAYHIGSWNMFNKIAGNVPDDILNLLKSYWPGPITFLININGIKTGFRFPDCTVAITFLEACGVPVMATSANISNETCPTDINMTSAIHDYVEYIIDAGPTKEKGASTVVDLTTTPPECLRKGIIPWP